MPKKGEIDLRKLKYWKAVFADFEKSGLSGQAYCNDRCIPYTAFANRRRRLPDTIQAMAKAKSDSRTFADESFARKPSEQVGFAEVAIKDSLTKTAPSTTAERLELVLLNGTVLRVPNGYSPVALAEIVSALEG